MTQQNQFSAPEGAMRGVSQGAMTARDWALLLLLSLIWGSSFLLIKIGVTSFPALTMIFLRSVTAAFVLYVVARWWRVPLPGTVAMWKQFAVLSVINNIIPFLLIFKAAPYLPSGLAAVLNATVPLWGVLLTILVVREPVRGGKIAGALTGFAGVAVLAGADVMAPGFSMTTLMAQLAIVLASLSYAVSSLYARRFTSLPPLTASTAQMICTSLFILPFSLAFDQPWTMAPPPLEAWLAVIGLGVLCTAIAYILYFSLLASAGSINVLLVTFIMPVVAVMLGVILLDETLDAGDVAGMVLIAVGLALIDGRLPRRLSEAFRTQRPIQQAADGVIDA